MFIAVLAGFGIDFITRHIFRGRRAAARSSARSRLYSDRSPYAAWQRTTQVHEVGEAAARVRAKYLTFRELLSLNNESLERMAALQDDLQFVQPRREVLGDRVGAIFDGVAQVVGAFERLSGLRRKPWVAPSAPRARKWSATRPRSNP